jgi:hypothetical protein
MISDLIVFASAAFAAAFAAAWAMRPGLRAWIERPKFEFQDALRGYDSARAATPRPTGDHPRD